MIDLNQRGGVRGEGLGGVRGEGLEPLDLGEELEKLAAFEAQSSTVRKTITNHTSASTATSTARCGSNNARNNRINSCSLVMSPPCSSAPDHCIYQTSQLAAASLLHLHKDLNEVGFAS